MIMKRLSLFPLFLFGTAALQASTLSVYQDTSLYTYTPKSSFIGVIKGVTAACEGKNLPLHAIVSCPGDKRLCQDLTLLKRERNSLNALQFNDQLLDKLISLPQPVEIDAEAWIKAAKRIGEEKAMLLEEMQKKKASLRLAQQAFTKQAPSEQVMVSDRICRSEMQLTLPYGYISFSSNYEADLGDGKSLTVTQKLSLTNRSGIDIKAEQARFYYRSAKDYVRPQHFYPWIVRKYEPQLRQKRMLSKRAMHDVPLMEAAVTASDVSMNAAAPKMVTASQVDSREYSIRDLDLPSNGVPLEVPVSQWKVPVKCGLKLFPYVNAHVFEVCSFTPTFQIENNQWRVMSGKVIVNEKAQGQYYEGNYDLYTRVDRDIQVLRKRMVKNERETGLFGTTVREKDGYTLTLTNKSDKKKSLSVTERIPTSTNDAIKVKLLDVKSKKRVDYKIDKEGKIEMQVVLSPKERREITVVFEIAYDKALKVRY